jgi:hypothetical protein
MPMCAGAGQDHHGAGAGAEHAGRAQPGAPGRGRPNGALRPGRRDRQLLPAAAEGKGAAGARGAFC